MFVEIMYPYVYIDDQYNVSQMTLVEGIEQLCSNARSIMDKLWQGYMSRLDEYN